MTLPEADASVREFGRQMVHDEARALDALADSLGEEFEKAVSLILECKGKLIVSGLGKSGHIGRKIAATVASGMRRRLRGRASSSTSDAMERPILGPLVPL